MFGATGHYGQRIAEKLKAKGIHLTILTRDVKKAKNILGSGVSIIEGNVTKPENVYETLVGAESIIVSLSAMSWSQIKKIREIEVEGLQNIISGAEKLKIERLVFISVYDINESFAKEQNSHILADTKLIAEKLIKNSRLNWTILGCPPSYELFFRLLRKNSLNVPGGGYNSLVCISPEDVGEITAQAVLRNDLTGLRFRLAGPETINFPQFAQKVSAITNHKINHRRIPLGMSFRTE